MSWKRFPPIVFLLLAGGCYRQSSLNPHGPAAREIGNLEWSILGLFCLITLVMWGLIVAVISRRRGTLNEHEPVDIGGGQNWIFIGGFAIPILILAGVFTSGLVVLADFPMHDGMRMPPAQIRVIGHQWWWEVQYQEGPLQNRFTTANEIHIPAGQPVDIDLASFDVIHSFWVPMLHGKVDLIPGVNNRIRIQAARPGTYRGQCAEYCGEEHARMNLLVIAQTRGEYQRWAANQLRDAVPPANAQEQEGEQVFLTRLLLVSHSARHAGDGQGRSGPDTSCFAPHDRSQSLEQ